MLYDFVVCEFLVNLWLIGNLWINIHELFIRWLRLKSLCFFCLQLGFLSLAAVKFLCLRLWNFSPILFLQPSFYNIRVDEKKETICRRQQRIPGFGNKNLTLNMRRVKRKGIFRTPAGIFSDSLAWHYSTTNRK